MKSFKEIIKNKDLLNTINQLKFETPTEIQEKTIPLILEKKDVIGESATGSGKTLAFGCGIIENTESGKGLQSLILTPTRELAEQVKESINQITRDKKLTVTSVYGGVSINHQISKLKKVEIVVATPGRLLDHLQRKTINLSKIKTLVLDEADRMLDMGFIEDIEKIIQNCPKNRQTLFFSATFENRIRNLSKRYMNNPIKISAIKHVDSTKLEQTYYDNLSNKKLSLLIHLLKEENVGQAMIFCNTRRTTDFVVKNLKYNGIKSSSIHGGLTQNKRTGVLQSFEDKKILALVCTDVAARGLHIDNVSHVYNYEIPNDTKDYVHRIGRTARAGEEGKAINLLCNTDYDNFSRMTRDYPDFEIKREQTPTLTYVKAVKVNNEFQGKRNFSRKPFGKRRSNWKGKRRNNFGSKPSNNRSSSFNRGNSQNSQVVIKKY